MMLKGIIHSGSKRVLLLGLSDENLKRLRNDDPIFFEVASIPEGEQGTPWDGTCDAVAIISGPDEGAMTAWVRDHFKSSDGTLPIIERADATGPAIVSPEGDPIEAEFMELAQAAGAAAEAAVEQRFGKGFDYVTIVVESIGTVDVRQAVGTTLSADNLVIALWKSLEAILSPASMAQLVDRLRGGVDPS